MTSHVQQTTFSHSSLNLHKQCPKKYFHIKVERDVKQTWGSKGNKAKIGDMFHKAVETCLLTDMEQLPPAFHGYPKYIKTYDIIRKARHSIRKMTGNNYMSKPELSLAIDQDFKPIPYFKTPEGTHKMFCGRIDYAALGYGTGVDEHAEGKFDRAICLDIKTGNPNYSTPDQLDRMALLIFCCYPWINQINAAYIWTEEDALVEKFKYTRKDNLQLLKDTLSYDIDTIDSCESKGMWPAIQSGLCKKHCAVPSSLCEHSGLQG